MPIREASVKDASVVETPTKEPKAKPVQMPAAHPVSTLSVSQGHEITPQASSEPALQKNDGESLKILLVVTKGGMGGAQRRIADLAKQYKKEGHWVAVAWGAGSELGHELEEANIRVFAMKHLKRSHNPISLWRYSRQMKRFLKEYDFDVVHFNSTNTLPGARAVKKAKGETKTIFTFRGLSMLDPNSGLSNYKKFIYWLYFKTFLRYIDEPVFQCERNRDDAKTMFLSRHGKVIYPGIDTNRLDLLPRDRAREYLSLLVNKPLTDDFIMGVIGRCCHQKNYDFLIDHFGEVLEEKPGAKLCIIGGGPHMDRLTELIRLYGLEENIFITGEREDASRVLPAFDLFVLPSRFEGISVALTEALFADIPRLATNVGGNPEVLCGDEEARYELHDSEDFLDKFVNFLDNGQKRPDEKCKNRFRIEESARKYLELYHA